MNRKLNLRNLDRRRFMRQMSLAPAVLPLVSGLHSWRAYAEPLKKRRMVIMFSPNGTIPPDFFPSGNENDFTLPRILEPLAPYQNRLLIIKGLRNAVPGYGASLHAIAVAGLLTGCPMIPGADGNPEGPASGMSVDQAIARFFAANTETRTRFSSLEIGESVAMRLDPRTRISYAGAGSPLPPENDPSILFARLFGGIERNTTRRSVLDSVLADLRRIRPHLSGDDGHLMDGHIEAIRGIEQAIAADQQTVAQCNTTPISPVEPWNRPAISRQQIDILVRAFACDQTRVATLQFTNGTSFASFPWLEFSDAHHDLSHADDADQIAREKLVKINRWYCEQFAYLLGSLQAIPESGGDGSLLDHTVVVWVNDFSSGNRHSRWDIPVVIAGAGDYFRLGRSVQLPETFHNRLLISLCRSMGLETDTFGAPELSTGGALRELT